MDYWTYCLRIIQGELAKLSALELHKIKKNNYMKQFNEERPTYNVAFTHRAALASLGPPRRILGAKLRGQPCTG